MDQESPMVDTVNEVADPWSDKAEDLVREFARTQNAIAGHHASGVTHPGDTADMNAPLVNAIRHAKTLEFVLDLHGLADNLRRMEDRASLVRARQSQRERQEAYQLGVADGVEKGKQYHAQEVRESEVAALHGNPEDRVLRETKRVIIPKGYVAAWHHKYEDPDGTAFQREVYGVLDLDVREGDTRAVVMAGPDRLLIALNRVRFAPALATLVAERDLKALEHVEVLHSDQSVVRVVDSMDKSARLDVTVHTLEESEAAEGATPGTYVRLRAVMVGDGDTIPVDLTKDQWQALVQAVETLYARRVITGAEGDEE